MLHPHPQGKKQGCRIVYISPLKALAVDVERNLRSPLAGIANMARRRGVTFHEPLIGVRTGDTPQRERREPDKQEESLIQRVPTPYTICSMFAICSFLGWGYRPLFIVSDG